MYLLSLLLLLLHVKQLSVQSMAPISSLPVEILEHIIDHLAPEDLENFAFASKRIQLISAVALETHRQLIRKYTLISGPSTSAAVEPVLMAVLANHRIGHYVKRIELGRASSGRSEDLEGREEENEFHDESEHPWHFTRRKSPNADQIHAAVDESKLFDPQSQAWTHTEIDRGSEEIKLLLFLSLLPNLTAPSIWE